MFLRIDFHMHMFQTIIISYNQLSLSHQNNQVFSNFWTCDGCTSARSMLLFSVDCVVVPSASCLLSFRGYWTWIPTVEGDMVSFQMVMFYFPKTFILPTNCSNNWCLMFDCYVHCKYVCPCYYLIHVPGSIYLIDNNRVIHSAVPNDQVFSLIYHSVHIVMSLLEAPSLIEAPPKWVCTFSRISSAPTK